MVLFFSCSFLFTDKKTSLRCLDLVGASRPNGLSFIILALVQDNISIILHNQIDLVTLATSIRSPNSFVVMGTK